jgi:hypothetical protein
MVKLNVYQNGKLIDTFTGIKDRFGRFIAKDCYNHDVAITTWSKAMNYINTDANRTAGNGDVYYDSYEDAVECWNQDYPEDAGRYTMEQVKNCLNSDLIATECKGYIEEVEDDDNEDNDSEEIEEEEEVTEFDRRMAKQMMKSLGY